MGRETAGSISLIQSSLFLSGTANVSWRFRKSFTPIPGVRLTLSPRGITTSVGVGPFRVTSGASGVALTAHLPGTGLSFRQPLTPRGSDTLRQPQPAGPLPPLAPGLDPPSVFPTSLPLMQEIRSAESTVLTSTGLAAFKETLSRAQHQHATVQDELTDAQQAEARDVALCRRWADGWLFKRVMKRRFAEIQARAEEAQALRSELQEQLQLSRLHTQFEMPDEVAREFTRLCEAFDGCARSQRVWDNVAHRSTNQRTERTIASRIVDRKPVRFALGQCGVIDAPMPVPHLQNANGGDIYLYPGFLVYFASATNYGLIETAEVELTVQRMGFHEEESIPSDATQVGVTWAKTNKDGSPDRRFKENYQIPVMQYARLTLRSSSGLNEEYILSNVAAAEALEQTWRALCSAGRRGI